MNTRSEFYGTELDWFAIDSRGAVALMSSAGYGPIPDAVFERFEGQRRIEEHLNQLIRCSTFDLKRQARLLSKGGVFTYDWKHWKGPYKRIGFALFPKHIDQLGLPPELRDAFVTLPTRFWTNRYLRPESLVQCTTKETNPPET